MSGTSDRLVRKGYQFCFDTRKTGRKLSAQPSSNAICEGYAGLRESLPGFER